MTNGGQRSSNLGTFEAFLAEQREASRRGAASGIAVRKGDGQDAAVPATPCLYTPR